MKTKETRILKRLGVYMGSRKRLSYAGVACSAVAHIIALLPFVFIWLILRELLGDVVGGVDGNRIYTWAWYAVGSGILYLLLYWLALLLTHIAAFRIERTLRGGAMAQMLRLPLGFFEKQETGKLKSVIDDNAGLIHNFCAHQLADLSGAIACVLVIFGLMLTLDWRMGLLCFIPIIVQIATISSMMRSEEYRSSMDIYMDHLQRMSSEAVEYVRGMPVVKTFQQSIYSFNAFHKTITDYTKWVTKYALSCKRPMSIFTVASYSYAFILLPFAIYLLFRGEPVSSVISNLVFFILVTPFIGECTMRLMYVISGKRQAAQALDRVEELFAQEEQMSGHEALNPESYTIRLEDVTFRYAPDKPIVLNDVSLTIPQGMKVALVGASGSGKTTLARLIARFWDVDDGKITIGGVDISKVAPEEVMKQISFVFQNEKLFKTTVRDNVTYGCEDITPERLKEALTNAQCTELIEKLPNGLDTIIGTKGIYLSGGEQQRIALARAFLKDAPILLLDEATSFADPENEQTIQEVLAKLMEGKTVLMIAHRLSSVVNADKIVVMNGGQIIEQGTHEQLLGQEGSTYAEMWDEYQESIEWTI